MVHKRLTLDQSIKGAIGELEFSIEATKMGYTVLRPVVEGCRYDLVLEKDGKFTKIQVKYITPKNGCIHLDVRKYTDKKKYLRYTKVEIDAMGVITPYDRKVYVVPIEVFDGTSGLVSLRLVAPANGQVKNVRLAKEYEIGKVL